MRFHCGPTSRIARSAECAVERMAEVVASPAPSTCADLGGEFLTAGARHHFSRMGSTNSASGLHRMRRGGSCLGTRCADLIAVCLGSVSGQCVWPVCLGSVSGFGTKRSASIDLCLAAIEGGTRDEVKEAGTEMPASHTQRGFMPVASNTEDRALGPLVGASPSPVAKWSIGLGSDCRRSRGCAPADSWRLPRSHPSRSADRRSRRAWRYRRRWPLRRSHPRGRS
jgi:hypothetical protein